MRIRTDGDYEHRKDTIEAAANRLDCNKTKAVLVSCDVVGSLLDNLEDALEHEEISPRVKREIAAEISTRKIEIDLSNVEASVAID
ncbi:DUF7692 domain-containing protein [Halobacterium zhouii]|uniref:DUF7692 domain-containing protein n=1 Tax=Halobacterium zhouii TaxID=2902624 RepID=UPI001E46A87D|nr:hypothetical protein [Halobacterium zhouii]